MPHTWNDFYEGQDPPLGPQLPLTSGQQHPVGSGVLPSGESNFQDVRQDRSLNPNFDGGGSGINFPWPYPNEDTEDKLKYTTGEIPEQLEDKFTKDWGEASGVCKTYPADVDVASKRGDKRPRGDQSGSGIFHPKKLLVNFSNSSGVKQRQVDDFRIFNNYIHFHRTETDVVPQTVVDPITNEVTVKVIPLGDEIRIVDIFSSGIIHFESRLKQFEDFNNTYDQDTSSLEDGEGNDG